MLDHSLKRTRTIISIRRKILKPIILFSTNFYMLDSTYLQASNPSSMRDQGICRNTVYNMTPGADPSASQQFYDGKEQFMASAYQFKGEKERLAYVKAHQGDRKVQGVIDYKNQDLYSFGGRQPIGRAYREASQDLSLIHI